MEPLTYYDLPGPGICILVRIEDASLRLWEHRRADGSHTSWPIWHGQVTRRTWPSTSSWALFVPGVGAGWQPVLLGDQPFSVLREAVNKQIFWTSPREGKDRRALYLPKMSREALISLATDLEARSDRGVKQVNREEIGVWIQRVWEVIEANELTS